MRKLSILVGAAALAIAAGGLAGKTAAQPYGPGMMNGYGPGYGMMNGYGPGYGMMNGYGPGYGMMNGYGPGYGMMNGYGPGMMYGQGYANQADMKLTVDQVKNYLTQMIRNPNLTVGEIKEKDADTIVAEVVTKQGNSLVQRLDFNRHNGSIQPEQ